MNIRIGKLEFFMLLSDIIENSPAFEAISDNDGYIVVPQDKYEDFAVDMGRIIGRIIEKIAKPE